MTKPIHIPVIENKDALTGDNNAQIVTDIGTNQLLKNILEELKKINISLSLITDDEIENGV